MCLEVIAVPAKRSLVSPERLSALSGLCVRKASDGVPAAFHLALEPGCSCSLLGEAADWERPTWDFSPAGRNGLAKAVSAIAELADGLEFSATWIGEQPLTRERTRLSELLEDIRENKVRNRHVYVVGRAQARVDAVPEA